MDNKNYLGPPSHLKKPTKLPPPPPQSRSEINQDAFVKAFESLGDSLKLMAKGIERCVDILSRALPDGEEETRQKQPKPQPEGEPQNQQAQH